MQVICLCCTKKVSLRVKVIVISSSVHQPPTCRILLFIEIPLEEFVKKMKAEQKRAYESRLAEKKRQKNTSGSGGGKPADAQINCKQCGRCVSALMVQ